MYLWREMYSMSTYSTAIFFPPKFLFLYLLSSFVSKATNHRTDEYGGSFTNRIRFPLEVLAAIRQNTGHDYPVVFRINGSDFIKDGITPDEAAAFAMALEKAGVDAIDVSAGVYGSIDTMIEPIQYEEGWKLYLAENIRKHVSIPVFGVGVIHDPAKADQAIADGKVDFVCVGRELLCEPRWVSKAAAGDSHFVKCIGCNSCFERIGKNLPIRCAVNALAGRELHVPAPAENPLRIAVVGAGPAGITAAVTASGRGHRVTLYEREDRIGGQLVLAGTPPRKGKILEYISYLEEELKRSAVELRLGYEFTADDAKDFDRVIVAAGARCRDIPVEGSGFEFLTAWETLRNKIPSWSGRNVLVIGAGSVGCETALYIKENGAGTVTVVEMRDRIAADMDNISRLKLLHELAECGVRTLPSTVLDRVEDGLACLKGSTNDRIPCDTVVEAVGAVPDRTLCEALYQEGIPFISIGDAANIGKIGEAVRGGFDAAATV